MDSICEDIKEDMHKIEEDSKKTDCYAILDLIGHCIQCFIDSVKCCFNINESSLLLSIYRKKWKT